MSDSLPAPPSEQPVSPLPPPPAEAPPVLPPSALPPAALKPLLNPLQTLDTPPASTVVEPPRSPNPANAAIDETGRNAELPVLTAPESAVRSPVAPAPAPPVEAAAPPAAIIAPQAAPVETPASVDIGAEIEAHGDHSPLAIDAPVPPSPLPPHDEVVPPLAPGVIPSAVATPTVLATEDDEMLGVPATGGTFPPTTTPSVGDLTPVFHSAVASPALAPVAESAPQLQPVPAPAEPVVAPQAVAHPPLSAPMEVDGEADAAGEDEEMPPARPVESFGAPEANGQAVSLKRPGEELAGSDEKRRQTETPVQAAPPAPAPAPAPTPSPAHAPVHYAPPIPAPSTFYTPPAPAAPAVPTPITYVPTAYAPPPPRDAGPITPLTQTQHKHLLNAVRALKKNKDAVNFLLPVDVVLFGIPHYVNIVKNPMDLGTVETKLIVSNPRGPPKDKSKMGNWDTSKGRYNSVSEVVQDVRQIWENTRMFNGPDHLVSQMATRLEAIFEKSLATMPAEPPSFTQYASPAPVAAAGPSAPARRASISQPPAPRRSSDGLDRPKREIHPPPSKELPYANDQARKKRRPDAQINYLTKQIRMFETKHMDLAGPFLYPVEEIIAQIPDYTLVVKNPIDLNHIKAKINEGDYDEAKQLNADFRLMCKNAMTFNPATHDVHIAAARFLKLWDEKWKALPPKEVPVSRSYSEDIVVDDAEAEDDEFEDDPTIIMLREQMEGMRSKIEQIKAERRKNRPAKVKKAKAPRKQSISQAPKFSPGLNGNGHAAAPKKPRKSKDVSYHEDNGFGGDESEEEVTTISLTQKQELAEKITQVDGPTLQKAIDLIAKSTGLDGSNEEIELDIDSLPTRTIVQLYNLVCRGRTPKKGPGRPKQFSGSGVIQGKKPGRKPGKKHMNEQEEAERIKRMEAQLQTFQPGAGGQGGQASGANYDESDSSDDEESEED